ncbi:hypothetical protein [Arthrobacter cavernae]|uniref:Uncharacterized protein n=1 Tax=Arthrobacter cavernae TaxID=2817681 RepID=A0A939KHY3_9MICC|nr:hypothetical protein [Arthrobacter cavernae]MBO1267072.1 hypothetical protein [Arthrobacter cavernae]
MINPYLMPTKKKGEKLITTGWGFYPPLKQALVELARAESERLEKKISVPTIIRTLTTVSNPTITTRRQWLAIRVKQIEKEKRHEAKK